MATRAQDIRQDGSLLLSPGEGRLPVPSSIRLWLDDMRPAPDGWLHVKTVDQAKYFLSTGRVVQMSLDHDLGEETETGYDLLLWIEAQVAHGWWNVHLPTIFVHSANPVGRQKMFAALQAIQRLAL